MTDATTTEQSTGQQDPLLQVPENFRFCTAPLQTSEIREFFENKELFYILNHTNSKIKGSQFLVYATNLDLPCDIAFEWPLPYDEYEQILLAYMNQNSVTKIVGMHVMAAQMLLLAKGIPMEENPYALPIPDEHIAKFIESHKDQILRWLNFIDSTPVFAIHSIEVLRNHYKPLDVFEVIDDRNYVGPNIAGLFGVPEFIGTYFRATEYKLNYFQPQFEEYMFKGAHLSRYFDVEHNLATILFTHYAQGVFTASEVSNSMFKIGVFSEKMKLPEYKYDPSSQPESPEPTGEPAI